MEYKIALIKGDGIGPEIINESVRVLDKISSIFSHKFIYSSVLAGGIAIDETGNPLPKESLDICKNNDSILLGAVGGPKWDLFPGDLRPEKALLELRKGLNLFTNLRPAVLFKGMINDSPLRKDIAEKGFDIMMVRELTGGIYFGKNGRITENNQTIAFDTESYSASEIERIGAVAFLLARKRNKKVTSIDKANILESSRLWREIMQKIAEKNKDIEFDNMLVDNAAMQLVKNPSQFDVIVTNNMFGDILSDESSMITGSIGLLPSASLGYGTFGMYEPVHGSAPDIAGKNIANPIATILSVALMLRYSFSLEKEAELIEKSVQSVLDNGYRTIDITSDKTTALSTTEMTDKILEQLEL